MLRVMAQLAGMAMSCILCVPGATDPLVDTLVFHRDDADLDLLGSCLASDASGLWMFVMVRSSGEQEKTVEQWFLSTSGNDFGRVEVVSTEPVSRHSLAGCVSADDATIAWRLGDRGALLLYRVSRTGLDPIGEFGRGWSYPVLATSLGQEVMTFVASDAIGILRAEAGTFERHRQQWAVAAWIDAESGDVFSVRAVAGVEGAEGYPPVALTREAVSPDGSLRLLASTDSWLAMEALDDEAADEPGVNYNVVAIGDEVVLMRNQFFGTGRLHATVRGKGALQEKRAFVVGMGGPDLFDASAVAGHVVLAGPTPNSAAESVRLLHMDLAGRVKESAAVPVFDRSMILGLEVLHAGSSIYAVATQYVQGEEEGMFSRLITVDVFPVPGDLGGERPAGPQWQAR